MFEKLVNVLAGVVGIMLAVIPLFLLGFVNITVMNNVFSFAFGAILIAGIVLFYDYKEADEHEA